MDYLLNAAVTTTATALAILLLKAIFRNRMSPNLHFCIWILLLVRILLPDLPQSPFSIFNLLPAVGNVRVMEHPAATETDHHQDEEAAYARIDKSDVNREYITGDIFLGRSGRPFSVRKGVETGMIIVWGMGAAILFLFLMAVYTAFCRRLRRIRFALEDPVPGLLDSCKREMRITRKVGIKRYGDTSLLMGIFRPVILLPEGYDSEEARQMLLHELWHLKHNDIIWNFLSTVILCLNWYNPILWICYYSFKRDMEVLCDQKVIELTGNKKEYASLLLRASVKSDFPLPMTTCMNHSKKDIKRRILFMADFKKPNALRLFAMVLSIALLGAGCLSGGVKSSEADVFSFSSLNPLLGKEKEEVLETLKLDPEKDATLETVGDSQETYTLKETLKIGDSDTAVSVIFYNGILMGFTYQFDNVESGYQSAKQLRQQAEEAYGEPTTYPTLENRLDNLKSADDIDVSDTDNPNKYYEEWAIQAEEDVLKKLIGDREIDRFTVNLELNCVSEKASLVTFRYAAVPKSLR